MTLADIHSLPCCDTLLLDRDGTINVRRAGDYVRTWQQFQFVPGAVQAIARLSQQARHTFIVTNQRGVGRGLFTDDDLRLTHQHMLRQIEAAGGRIDGIYISTAADKHDPGRKPNPGMFRDICRDHPDVKPETTVMIGDSDSDIEFAHNCGIRAIRVDDVNDAGSETQQ